MGSPTSDDDPTPTQPASGPGGWGGQQGTPPPSPPPGRGGGSEHDQETTRLPQQPGESQRGQTAPFPQMGGGPPPGTQYPQGPGAPYPRTQAGPYPQGPGGQYPQGPGAPFPPGPGGPYAQGPYPPGGPGGPYPPQGGYGPGGPPPGGGGSRRGLVIALVVGLVILAGVAIALVFAFTREGGETASADPTPPTSPASTPSSAEPTPTESSSAAPSPTGTAGDRTDELLATVPADFTDCEPTDLAGDGDVAAVRCGASTTQPGAQSAFFYLYEDAQTLDEVFVADADEIEPMPEGEDCTTAQGVTVWNVDGEEGGNIACTITDDGLLIAWTDREFGIEGVVRAPGTTQEELAELADWWRNHTDFQR